MKILLIILGVLFIAFLAVQLYSLNSHNKIESYPYTIIKKFKGFEIRKYEARLFSTVKLETNKYENASNRGFSILAGYIFGGNDANEKIAMTSPVAMSLDDSITMMFMLPKVYTMDKLPNPNQKQIEFHEEPIKVVAAIEFGAWASSKKIDKYKEKLRTMLEEEGIAYTTNFYYLGYNPPYEVINRKNEIIVELTENP